MVSNLIFQNHLEEFLLLAFCLLSLIDWINKDRSVAVACDDVVENSCSKVKYAALGNQEIQPGMWNLP